MRHINQHTTMKDFQRLFVRIMEYIVYNQHTITEDINQLEVETFGTTPVLEHATKF